MADASTREKRNARVRSLASYLGYFEGIDLTVELKNGQRWSGTLLEADDFMNIMLQTATTTRQDKNKSRHTLNKKKRHEATEKIMSNDGNDSKGSKVYIRGSTIRFVQFPNHVNLCSHVQRGQDRERAASRKYQRPVRKKK